MLPPEITLDSRNITVGQYPGGEPLVRLDHLRTPIRTMMLRPQTVSSLMAGLWIADALAERGDPIYSLVLPYLPGARQDRMNPEGDALFTAKSVAREINLRNFDQVLCFDPHSEVMPALIDRCDVLRVNDFLHFAWTQFGMAPQFDAVISPDAGAEKRASGVAKLLGLPLVHAWKQRNLDTGLITGFGHQPLSPEWEHLLVVDDICDGGGTFNGLADTILAADANVDLSLYVSHGIFSGGYDDLSDRFVKIYTTNSTTHPDPSNPQLQILDVLDALGALTKDPA